MIPTERPGTIPKPTEVGYWWCRPFGLYSDEDFMAVEVKFEGGRKVAACVERMWYIPFRRLDRLIKKGWKEWVPMSESESDKYSKIEPIGWSEDRMRKLKNITKRRAAHV